MAYQTTFSIFMSRKTFKIIFLAVNLLVLASKVNPTSAIIFTRANKDSRETFLSSQDLRESTKENVIGNSGEIIRNKLDDFQVSRELTRKEQPISQEATNKNGKSKIDFLDSRKFDTGSGNSMEISSKIGRIDFRDSREFSRKNEPNSGEISRTGKIDFRDSRELRSRETSQNSFRFEDSSPNDFLRSNEVFQRGVENKENDNVYLRPSSHEYKGIRFETDKFSGDEDKESKDAKGKVKWEGWNYVDTTKGNHLPHEKTISLQFMDDDGRFAHSPPAWPHDEYLLQFPSPNNYYQGLRNNASESISGSGDSSTNQNNDAVRYNEWKKLRPVNSLSNSIFMGPGFYDDGSGSQQYNYYPQQQISHQAITDGSVSTISTNSDGQNSGTESAASNSKLYPGGGNGYNHGYGNPYDFYRRKRLRFKLHPGLIAAPIAGFAAYKAVSAIASKPLLFELGWVNNKPNIGFGVGGGGIGGGGIGGIGGGGWPAPVYPYPYPQPIAPLPNHPYHPGGGLGGGGVHPIYIPQVSQSHGFAQGGGGTYPILRPPGSGKRSTWWNPFAALTPRFRNRFNSKKDEVDECNEDT